MKKLVVVAVLAPLLMLALSCASKPAPAPQSDPVPVEQPAPPPAPPEPAEPAQVMEKYSGDIILEGAKNYRVARGDTLTRIAIGQYGRDNAYYFPLILMASRKTVNDPDKIAPGMTLTVPNLQRNLNDAGARQKIKEYLNELAGSYGSQSKKTWGKPTAAKLKALAASL